MTIDNLLSADVMLADGSHVTADAEHHSGLFWALRGGGNFGVVTSFEFRLNPVHTIIGGPTLWHLDQAPDVLTWYCDFVRHAPRELNGFFAFLTVPPAPPFPPSLQGSFDALYPPGHQWYWRGDFVRDIPDDAIARHVDFAAQMPTMLSTMHLYPIDGAAAYVPADATAWNHRDANWSMAIGGVDPDPASAGALRDWAVGYWNALHPLSAGGAYVNFLGEGEGADRVRATYGGNYDRLAQIKSEYDPANLFRINQNIHQHRGRRDHAKGRRRPSRHGRDVRRQPRHLRGRAVRMPHVDGRPVQRWLSRC